MPFALGVADEVNEVDNVVIILPKVVGAYVASLLRGDAPLLTAGHGFYENV